MFDCIGGVMHIGIDLHPETIQFLHKEIKKTILEIEFNVQEDESREVRDVQKNVLGDLHLLRQTFKKHAQEQFPGWEDRVDWKWSLSRSATHIFVRLEGVLSVTGVESVFRAVRDEILLAHAPPRILADSCLVDLQKTPTRFSMILDAARKHLADIEDLRIADVAHQARQSLESALAGYTVDKVDFLTLLDNQVTLLNWEIKNHRELTYYEQNLARLENVVGKRID